MGSEIMLMDGMVRRGGDIPCMDPNKLVIVGGPGESDIPYSDTYKGFYCPRAAESVEDDFVQSIRTPNRVYETIHAVKFGSGKEAQLFVVAHRRCVKAARIIWNEQAANGTPAEQRVVVRVQIHNNLTQEQIYDLNTDENGQKKDLSPVQKAQHLAHAASVMGLDQRTIGIKFKMAQSAVANTLAILRCAPEIQAMFCEPRDSDNYLAPAHAPALALLAPHEQVSTVSEMRQNGVKTTGSNVREAVKTRKEKKQVTKETVTSNRTRTLVEKVRVSIWNESDGDLAIEGSGELSVRDRAIIALVLDWQTGKVCVNANLKEIIESCSTRKNEIETTF